METNSVKKWIVSQPGYIGHFPNSNIVDRFISCYNDANLNSGNLTYFVWNNNVCAENEFFVSFVNKKSLPSFGLISICIDVKVFADNSVRMMNHSDYNLYFKHFRTLHDLI